MARSHLSSHNPVLPRRADEAPARPGFTLTELLLVLTVLGILLSMVLPTVGRAFDVFAVRAARGALVAAAERARITALAQGGAVLFIDAPTNVVSILSHTGNQVGQPIRLGDDYGVQLALGGRDQVGIRYDALGLGRIANTTVRIERRSVEGRVIFSIYGRARAQ